MTDSDEILFNLMFLVLSGNHFYIKFLLNALNFLKCERFVNFFNLVKYIYCTVIQFYNTNYSAQLTQGEIAA